MSNKSNNNKKKIVWQKDNLGKSTYAGQWQFVLDNGKYNL